MATLERTEASGFSLNDSHIIAALEEMSEEERLACLLPTESLFSDLAVCRFPAFYERLCRNGCEIYQKKLGTSYETGTRLRLCSADGDFFALGEVREYEGGSAVKAIKFFDIGFS